MLIDVVFKILKKLGRTKQIKEEQSGNLACPDCGGLQFYDGPEGGMSRNICCAEESCNSAFNYHGFGKLENERIDNFYWFAEDDHRRKTSKGERPVEDTAASIDRRAAIRATKDKHV